MGHLVTAVKMLRALYLSSHPLLSQCKRTEAENNRKRIIWVSVVNPLEAKKASPGT